jgi:hypothetical protein
MATITHHETRRAVRDATVAVPRLDALERATEVRVLRGALKVDIKEGRVAIASVLRDPPAYLHTAAQVAVIVLAVPGYGPKRVEKLLARHKVAPDKTIGALSARQRQALAAHFEP